MHTCTTDSLLGKAALFKYWYAVYLTQNFPPTEGLTSGQVHLEGALTQLCDKLFEAWEIMDMLRK